MTDPKTPNEFTSDKILYSYEDMNGKDWRIERGEEETENEFEDDDLEYPQSYRTENNNNFNCTNDVE